MILKLTLSGFMLFLIVACTATISLYPVEGPLSVQRPLPVLKATASGIMGNSGSITMVAPDGEQFNGKWSSAAGSGVSFGTMSLFSQYATIYGSGFSTSPGRGQNPGRAFLVGDRGTTIDAEFVTGAGTANGFGFAKDNRGNVYRILF